MTLQTDIIINGSKVTDVQTCKISNSLGNEQSTSDIELSLLNPYGKNGSKYSAGQVTEVYLEDAMYDLMPESIRSGLTGYWRLEDKDDQIIFMGVLIGTSYPSPIKDSIGNYGDGTNMLAIRSSNGFINYGKRWFGDNDSIITISVDPNDVKQSPPSWTISFWNYYVDKAISGTTAPIYAIQADGTEAIFFYKSFNDETVNDKSRMWLSINEPSIFVGSGQLTPDNKWHHIVGTHDAGSTLTKLFINNTLVGSNYGTAWDGQIGSLFFGAIPYYGGMLGSEFRLDEIGIWNRALSNAEIGSLYNLNSGLSYGNKIFSGRIEDVNHMGYENTETINLGGRDWGMVILDNTVQPEVYTNLPAGSIVRDVVNKYASGISIQEVSSGGTIIDRVAFNHVPVFDAVKQMADLSDQSFFIDETRKLRFRDKNSISSQRTYDTEDSTNNILSSEFKERRDTMYNQIWVYGDRYLDGFQEKFTQTAGLGSEFLLTYKPHNTSIQVNGSIIQPGGVFGMTNYAVSGIKYLVDYDSKKIVFLSGTDVGNYIPGNGSVIIVDYKRSLPVVKVGDNESSKSKYGTRAKIIQDKSITDPQTAEMIMLKELENYSDPLKQGIIYIKGIDDIKIGETALLNIPHQGISGTRYEASEVQYTLDDETMQTENIMRIKFNKQLPDITDQIRTIMMNLRKLQSQDMSISDVITRYEFVNGSLGIINDWFTVNSRSIGSSFILANTVNGRVGSYSTHSLGFNMSLDYLNLYTYNYGNYLEEFIGSRFEDRTYSSGTWTGGLLIL
jgi:hypothetical protein